MNLRAFLVSGLLVCALLACTSGGNANDDCGANACGACQTGFVNSDRCEDGEWKCECVPRTGLAAEATTEDAGGEAASPADPRPVFTCQQALASPTTSARCVADDWDESCEQGCLSCRCSTGVWGCTTSASCFDAGGG